MLKKVVQLTNLGLLRNGVPKPAEFGEITLIYGENGRGKSTFASILKALGKSDVDAILDARTIDSDDAPALQIVCADGTGRPINLKLNAGTLSGQPPEFHVFDPGFIDENVYAGQEVLPDQREALIHFALGSSSVGLEKGIAELTKKISEAGKALTAAEKVLKAHAGALTVAKFIALPVAQDVSPQVEAVRAKLGAAKNAAAISQRPLPEPVQLVELDVDAFCAILASSFSEVAAEARSAVQAHIALHQNPPGIEDWVSKGLKYGFDHGCPLCGQDTSTAPLITAYEAYFSDAYERYMLRVSALGRGVEQKFSESKIHALESALKSNQARVESWANQLDVSLPGLDLNDFVETFQATRALAEEAAAHKVSNPLTPVGDDELRSKLQGLLDKLASIVSSENGEISRVNAQIAAFKQQIGNESEQALAAKLAELEGTVRRQTPEAAVAIHEFKEAEASKKELEASKRQKREEVDGLMPATLARYEKRINSLLGAFGAGFRIADLKGDYTGGPLRSIYGVEVRGKRIKLGKRGDKGPTFRTMLSEADKRTLALALFLAKLLEVGDALTGQVVVFDDPVSSLDANRRRMTLSAILDISKMGAQVVVLSHDAQFLFELREAASKGETASQARTHQIGHVSDGYSELGPDWDIDQFCESDYYRRHRIVSEFVNGRSTASVQEVQSSIRVMLEGFFKQRFPPPILPPRANLGEIISRLDAASPGESLYRAKGCVRNLSQVNDVAKDYHHEDGVPRVERSETELRVYAQMALELIYGEGH
ncbi:AAA family ATPase [Stenotrophomonas sp. PD6]|uniref:AAA family ATPase n=1 Tax=Stenotrophomonas sp. PD6 TaxID=3368612 RepID=UPI003B9FB1B7